MDNQLTHSARQTSTPLSWSVTRMLDLGFSDNFHQMFYESQIYYKCSINSSKLSVICMYMRIFRTTTQRWFMITCWCLGAIVLCYSIASIIGTIFQCTPIQYMWNRTQYHGHCISDTPFWIANAIYNIVTDAVIVASVPWVVNTLQVSKKQKFLLHCMFSLVLL